MLLRIFLLVLLAVVNVESAFRRVCYYTNWSQYRNSQGKFFPENVDPKLCTHLIYTFAKMIGNKLASYEWNDESTPWMKGMYARFNDLKTQNPNLKTLLAVGGWTMGSKPFTAMVASDANRRQFAATTVTFLRSHNFDGLDLDWEYPANRGSPATDKQNYVELLKILRQDFDADAKTSGKPKLLLSAAVPAGKDKIDTGYNVPEIVKYVDMLNLMAYDLHGSWDTTTGHNSGLFQHTGETGKNAQLNMDWQASYWVKSGAPPSMINIGMALYGRGFTLRDQNKHDLGDQTRGPGDAGRYTGEKGFLSYYEICNMLNNGGTRHYLPDQMVPYVVKGSQWVGYEDRDSIRNKVKYTKQHGYGGVMVWALDLDDFRGLCGQGKYPLLHTIVDELQKPGGAVVKPILHQTTPTVPKLTTHRVTTPKQATHAAVKTTSAPSPTTSQQNQLVMSSNFSCSGKRSGFYRNPHACDSYFICAAQSAFIVHCANALQYNEKTRYCDWPRNVHCNLNPQSGGTSKPITQTPKPVVHTSTPVLRTSTPAARTSTPAVHTNTPTYFPIFITNKPVVTHKPATQAPVTTPSTTRAPVYNTPSSNQGSATFCVTKPDGLYRDSNSCSHYYQCSFGLTFHEPCAPGLVFNDQTDNCDYFINVPACRNFYG